MLKHCVVNVVSNIVNAHRNQARFYTLLAEIEAGLNFLPLTPFSNDPNDISSLIPDIFLIGPLIAFPQENLVNVPTNCPTHGERIQQLKQHCLRR